MSEALETTFDLLGKTRNEAAVGVLIPAFDSPSRSIREAALAAILRRRSPAGQLEVLRRLHLLDDRSQAIVRRYRGRMTQTLRDAVLGSDRQLCTNGCRAAVWFREYDLLPALINVLEDEANPNNDLASQTVVELTRQLYAALGCSNGENDHRNPQFFRHQVVGALERSVRRFAGHKRREIIETFVLLVGRENVTLARILEDPRHAAFLVLVNVLSKSPAAGVIGLLLSFLDHPHAPSAALSVLAKRRDLEFIRYLLRKIGREPSAAVKRNLKRIRSIPWVRSGTHLLDRLDDAAQHAMVQLVMSAGIPRAEAFRTVERLLLHGKRGGRRAAAEALGEFSGAEANALTLNALNDEDPQVQAHALSQLRSRGIPGTLPRLVEMVDSRHAVVRNAARKGLAEFSFKRFSAAFDMLDEEVRLSTGALVKKVDPQTIPLLEAEMHSRVRTRRLRALAIVRTIGAVSRLERTIVRLLHDDDHMVRAEAAAALEQCHSPASRHALEVALNDRSMAVREAARKSLQHRARFPRQPEAFLDSVDEHG